MPRPKKEETLDLETPIEEVVESEAKKPAEKSKTTESKKAEVKPVVAKAVLTTELFAVQLKRTAD